MKENPNNYNEGEHNSMDNTGSLNATEIAVGSLLAGNRGYGYGGAWDGHHGYGGHGNFASPSANAVRLNRNAQQIENQADCTREVLGNSMDNNARAFNQAENNRSFQRVCDNITASEFRTGDRLRDLEREINANAREAAQCCCDTQKEILRVEANSNERFAAIARSPWA